MAYNRHFGYKYSHFGEDKYGHDVKVFGDTTDKYVFWDASENTLYVSGETLINGAGGWIPVSFHYDATSVDQQIFVANRAYKVKACRLTPRVAGGDAGAVTVMLEKCPSGTAPGSGTDLLTGTLNLKGTADTVQVGTLVATAASLALAAGDALALDFDGTLTAAVGVITVDLVPI